MKIAIVGSGISGLMAAHGLHSDHEITVFETGSYVGGHTNTVPVSLDSEQYAIDTGFIVYNHRTYPNFVRLLSELGVASQPTSMSFSVRCDRTGLEYRGANFNGLFAQRRNLVNRKFYRLLADILRFNRLALQLRTELDDQLTVGQFLSREKFPSEFAEQYLLPLGSAVWSCPRVTFAQFPIRFIVEFFDNHGLFHLGDRPQWRVIVGGSHHYVSALTRPWRDRIRLNCPVRRATRNDRNVELTLGDGERHRFDHVVFACHSDQALKILGAGATSSEREILSEFPYEKNVAVLHTDPSVLPRKRRAWASWNYHIPDQSNSKATVTYNMNILQGISSQHVFCVTLNSEDGINPDRILQRFVYHHPVFTTTRRAAQERHHELLNANRSSFCGAYWGNGFHEDGVVSALHVCAAIQRQRRPDETVTASSIGRPPEPMVAIQ